MNLANKTIRIWTFLLALLLAPLASTEIYAQQASGRIATPTLNSTTQSSSGISLIGTGASLHQFGWNTVGTVSAGACRLEKSADNSSWAELIAAQTVTSSGGPTAVTGPDFANYVRFNCTTPISGSGSVRFVYFGQTSTSTGTLSGDVTNAGTFAVQCTSGCAGGTTDADDGTLAGGQTTGLQLGLGYFWNGTNWVRVLGNATDGMLVNLGANNDVTITSGTITTVTTVTAVTAITNALPAGNNNVGDVDIASIAAGNNNIGDVDIASIAAGDNNIGNVDIVSLPSVTIGTFPDNEPFNIAQMNGVTVLMGNGTSGTGAQRVTLASDSTGQVAISQATPGTSNLVAISTTTGGAITAITDPCDGNVKTNFPFSIAAATTTQLVAASASNKLYVCGMIIVVGGANNVALVEDDTSACASPTAGMSGGTTAATGWNFGANGGLVAIGSGSAIQTAATNRYVCLITSGSAQTSGNMMYVLAP